MLVRKIGKLIFSILPRKYKNMILFFREYSYEQQRKKDILNRNKQKIGSFLGSDKPIFLELGASGRKIENWITIGREKEEDIRHDLLEPLPFPDNSVSQMYASHVLEHFSYGELMRLLLECYRTLKPGAIFKIEVPNARIFLDAYIKPDEFDVNTYCLEKRYLHFHSRIDYVNYIAYMGKNHHMMFDEENFPKILSATGFRNIKARTFDHELDIDKRKNSIYFECTK